MSYEKVTVISQATDKRYSETINFLPKRKYVILAFHNYGACSTLFSVKVSYNVCPDEALNNSLVFLPRTVAPANDSQPIKVEGNCNRNSVHVSGSLYVNCESNGQWNTNGLAGRCVCKEDMQNNEGICEGMFAFCKHFCTKIECVYSLCRMNLKASMSRMSNFHIFGSMTS